MNPTPAAISSANSTGAPYVAENCAPLRSESLSYVYDPQRDLNEVVILDAQDFAGEPVATIRLPLHGPFGFLGGWAPDRITVVE